MPGTAANVNRKIAEEINFIDMADERYRLSSMNRLKEYLASEGLRAIALARVVGCSPSLLSQYMKGKVSLSDDMKLRVSAATGGKVKPGDLLVLEPRERPCE